MEAFKAVALCLLLAGCVATNPGRVITGEEVVPPQGHTEFCIRKPELC